MFERLSFAVDSGSTLILRGPNGSGKSSLLRLMAGLLIPFEGTIRWTDAEGSIVEAPDNHHQRSHYVGHADAVNPDLSVTENIYFWAALRTPSPDVAGAMQALDIDDLADVPGRFLSAGQKRRVNLARILAAPADLWLLDEPTTSLDTDTVLSLRNAVAKHRAGGGIVVASTHQDLELANSAVLELDAVAKEKPACV